MRDGTVLLLCFGELLLRAEGFVGLWGLVGGVWEEGGGRGEGGLTGIVVGLWGCFEGDAMGRLDEVVVVLQF